jgi:hypothetical protein
MHVRFEVRPWEDSGHELLPLVDGMSLADLVSDFERAAGYRPTGGYAGLVLEHSNFGDLGNYLHGEADSPYWRESVALLGCNCGELGCWPLQARIQADDDWVTWTAFTQPHRPNRDYSTFGPFTFRRTQYDEALHEAVET